MISNNWRQKKCVDCEFSLNMLKAKVSTPEIILHFLAVKYWNGFFYLFIIFFSLSLNSNIPIIHSNSFIWSRSQKLLSTKRGNKIINLKTSAKNDDIMIVTNLMQIEWQNERKKNTNYWRANRKQKVSQISNPRERRQKCKHKQTKQKTTVKALTRTTL